MLHKKTHILCINMSKLCFIYQRILALYGVERAEKKNRKNTNQNIKTNYNLQYYSKKHIRELRYIKFIKKIFHQSLLGWNKRPLLQYICLPPTTHPLNWLLFLFRKKLLKFTDERDYKRREPRTIVCFNSYKILN